MMAVARPFGWRFIDLADLGNNRAHRYILTLLAIILLPILCLIVLFVAIFLAAAAHHLPSTANKPALFAAALASLAIAGFVLMLCVAYLHRRPWMSLISPDLRLDWRRLAIGAGVEAVLLGGVLAARHLAGAPAVRFGSGLGWPLLPILLLIPLQSASEEMLFRGYLTQALGRLIRSRIVIAVIVGVLFGALHFNAYGVLTIPYLTLLSLLFSLVSLRDERLELTIGAHTAMNWMAIGLAGALEASPADLRLNIVAMGLLLVQGAAFYGLTRLLVRLFCRDPAPA